MEDTAIWIGTAGSSLGQYGTACEAAGHAHRYMPDKPQRDKRTIPIAQPDTGEDEWRALRDPILSGWLTQGPKVAEFEQSFAEKHRVRHAIASTSGTTALHLALSAMAIGPGDEVILPSFTWVATANAVLYCGATPVFIDIDKRTFNLDPSKIQDGLTERTRAIVPVHLFGLCADMNAIRQSLPAGIKILEDAACAAGAIYQDRPAGALGDAAAFSFHPRKSITTGEGGMLTTHDDALAARARSLRNHGASESNAVRHHGAKPHLLPEFHLLGFNYRMTDLQAALGLVQLRKLDAFIHERSTWAAFYRDRLRDLAWLKLPSEPPAGRHAWQSFVTYVDPAHAPLSRNAIMERLQHQGIATRPGTHAVHMLDYYRDRFQLRARDFPNARDCDMQTMALPLHNRMTQRDYEYVVDALLEM